MLRMPSRIVATAFATACLGNLAFAGDHYRPVKADIDHLDADLHYDGAQWVVDVEYKVKLKTTHRIDGLSLVLHVDERGRAVLGAENQPLEVVVPLDSPTDVDDDEVKFKQSLSFVIPDGAFGDPGDLRLSALVATSPEEPILDRRDERIDFDAPRPPREVHVGVSFGFHSDHYVAWAPPVYHRVYVAPRRPILPVRHHSVTIIRRGYAPVHRSHHVRGKIVWRR